MQQPAAVDMGSCFRRDDQLHQVFRDDDLAAKILLHILGPVVIGDERIIAGYEVTHHQHFYAGGRSDAADVFGGGVAVQQVLLERRTVFGLQHEAIDGRQIHAFVHQHVGAFGEFGKPRIVGGVAGEHDGAVRRFEFVGEVIDDGRMRRAERRDLHVRSLQHYAVVRDVFRDQQFARIGTAFVLDPRLDVEPVQFPERFRHRLDALRTERVDRCRQARRPGVVEQIAVFEVVIGMVVGDEDVLHRRNRHTGRHQLAADAHAAIDHERRIVDHDKIGGIGCAIADARSALGAEEDDARARLCRRLRQHCRSSEGGGASERQSQRIAAIDHGRPPWDYLCAGLSLASAQHPVEHGQADDDRGGDRPNSCAIS
jgi:hypothetical protein